MDRVPPDLMSQYRRAEPVLVGERGDASGVLETARALLRLSEGRLCSCARSSRCSRVLEEALQYVYVLGPRGAGAPPELAAALGELAPAAAELARHSNASHVLQTLLSLASRAAREDAALDALFGRAVAALAGAADACLQSPHAVQVLRALLLLEAGLPPLGAREPNRNRHQFHALMAGALYGPRDPLRGRSSAHAEPLGAAVHAALARVSFAAAAALPDASALMQAYVDASAWDGPRGHAAFLPALLGLPAAPLLAALAEANAPEALGAPLRPAAAPERVRAADAALRAALAPAALGRLGQPQLFLLEKLLAQRPLQLAAQAFLAGAELGAAAADPRLRHLYQRCLQNAHRCPERVRAALAQAAAAVPAVLEADEDLYALSDAMAAANRFAAQYGAREPAEAAEVARLLRALQRAVAAHVGEPLARRLLFPGGGGPAPAEDARERDLRLLERRVDRARLGAEELRALGAERRAAHERLERARAEQKYGPRRGPRPPAEVYGPGKQILIQMLASPCGEVRDAAAAAFARGFLEGPPERVREALAALVTNPRLADVPDALARNRTGGLLAKLRAAAALRGAYAELLRARPGRAFVLDLVRYGLLSQVVEGDPAYSTDVNFDALVAIMQEVANHGAERALARCPIGAELANQLGLREYAADRPAWERRMRATLARLAQRHGLRVAARGRDVR